MSWSIPSAAPRWITGLAGGMLAVSAFYLLAIRFASPHPLPGLAAGSALVFAAGLAFVLRAVRLPRAEAVVHVLALLLGFAAIGDVAHVMLKSRTHAAITHPSTSPPPQHAAR